MKLSEWLNTNNLTQADFARFIKESKVSVHRYIMRGVKPRENVLQKIYEVTGGQVTANDFFHDNPHEQGGAV